MRSLTLCVVLIAQCVGCSQPKSKVSSSAHSSTDSGDASLAPPKAVELYHDGRLSVGSCSGFVIEFTDSTASADEPFNISTSAGTGKFYSDDSCTKPATSFTIKKGEKSSSFFISKAQRLARAASRSKTLAVSNCLKSPSHLMSTSSTVCSSPVLRLSAQQTAANSK